MQYILRKQVKNQIGQIKYPKLQNHAIKRYRTKDGKFASGSNCLNIPPFRDKKVEIKRSKINKYKKTNGIKPIFQIRRNYR